VAEVERNQDDLQKLGLAAYAKKNFPEARRLFTESAESEAQHLEQIRRKQQALAEKEAVLLEKTGLFRICRGNH